MPKWRLLSQRTGRGERFKKFFLYVPEGAEAEAERLLEENHIEYAGLRAWSIRDGVLMVRPVKTPDMAEDHRVSYPVVGSMTLARYSFTCVLVSSSEKPFSSAST